MTYRELQKVFETREMELKQWMAKTRPSLREYSTIEPEFVCIFKIVDALRMLSKGDPSLMSTELDERSKS